MGTEEVKGRRVPRHEKVQIMDGRKGRRYPKGPLAMLVIKEITPLCPGDRYEIFMPASRKGIVRFLATVRKHISRYVKPMTPFRYRCRKTATPGCLVIVE